MPAAEEPITQINIADLSNARPGKSLLQMYAEVHRHCREVSGHSEPTTTELREYVGGKRWPRNEIPPIRMAILILQGGDAKAEQLVRSLHSSKPEAIARLADSWESTAGLLGQLIDVMALAFERIEKAIAKVGVTAGRHALIPHQHRRNIHVEDDWTATTGLPADTITDLSTLPRRYGMILDGRCMEPEIADGGILVCERDAPYKPGGLVVLFSRPELVQPGRHQGASSGSSPHRRDG